MATRYRKVAPKELCFVGSTLRVINCGVTAALKVRMNNPVFRVLLVRFQTTFLHL